MLIKVFHFIAHRDRFLWHNLRAELHKYSDLLFVLNL